MFLALTLLACQGDPPAEPAKTAPHPPGQPGPPLGVGPAGPPGPGQMGPGGPPGSGGALQDPTGYPAFHDTPPAPGPAPEMGTAASPAVRISDEATGGFRGQIEVGPDDRLHTVYYDHQEAGDVVRYRTSADGATWSSAEAVSPLEGRNWGPDLAVRPDGRVWVTYDHAGTDFRSQTWFRERSAAGQWADAVELTPGGDNESGSGHLAWAGGDDIAFNYIGKKLGPEYRFVANWRWRRGGVWSEPVPVSDPTTDAWHTNVMSRPDGSVLAGWDEGAGQSATTVFVSEGRDGRFSAPENITATSHPGERVHFAFTADGRDWLTWFHKVGGFPLHVYARTGKPGAWGETTDLAEGFGGYHYDPFLAAAGNVVCLVWGWQGDRTGELLYSFNRGSGWETPRRAASIGSGTPELPSMAADSKGNFHVVWAQGTRGKTDIYYTKLTPG